MLKKTIYNDAPRLLNSVISILPPSVRRELLRIGEGRSDFPEGLSEIRIRCGVGSAAVLSGENLRLLSRVGKNEFNSIFDRVVGGSLYTHATSLKEGFVTLEDGVRVGICGDFISESGILRGVSALVFRLPFSRCEFAEDIFREWDACCGGMLIYSLPGGGKTSALRALAPMIAKRLAKRVVVIDERYEFLSSECDEFDVIRGYGKAKGIEIAKRTLSAEIILVDEIGSREETEALLSVGRGGIPVIATAHADSFAELCRQRGLAPLIEKEYFERFVHLYSDRGSRKIEIHKAEELRSSGICV